MSTNRSGPAPPVPSAAFAYCEIIAGRHRRGRQSKTLPLLLGFERRGQELSVLHDIGAIAPRCSARRKNGMSQHVAQFAAYRECPTSACGARTHADVNHELAMGAGTFRTPMGPFRAGSLPCFGRWDVLGHCAPWHPTHVGHSRRSHGQTGVHLWQNRYCKVRRREIGVNPGVGEVK